MKDELPKHDGPLIDWRQLIERHGTPVRFPNHLEPEDSAFDGPRSLFAYQQAAHLLQPAEAEIRSIVSELLYPEIVRVTCLPTYSVAWTLAIVGERKFGYTLLLTEPSYSMPPIGIAAPSDLPRPEDDEAISAQPIIHRRSEMQPELAGPICAVWRRVVSETRYPAQPLLGKCDGESYHFAYRHHLKSLPMAGQTWSPPEDSVPGNMVALSSALRTLALRQGAPSEAIQKIQSHLEWLNQQVGRG
jgi:hypothetical protein